jgi:arylformamidase
MPIFSIDPSKAVEISLPLDFHGPQPELYGVAPATTAPYRSGGWVGSVAEGGSCNFDTVTLTPHCNGTHTECIGHITREAVRITDVLREPLCSALLLTVPIVSASDTHERYEPTLEAHDKVITADNILRAWEAVRPQIAAAPLALVLRQPKDARSTPWLNFQLTPAAFFSIEAIQFLAKLPLLHLLTELPSVDRANDEGKMRAHHIWWGLPRGSHALAEAEHPKRTITELVWVPDTLADGHYVLDLQPAPFVADAAPSRVWLYPA